MASTDKICALRAGQFRNIDEDTSALLWFFFFFFSAFITAGIRFLVLGRVGNARPAPSNAGPPATTPCPRCQQRIDDALLTPPLSLPSESTPCPEELLAEAKRRISQKPSILRFAICTTLAILNIIAMVLMAFVNQRFIYCDSEVTVETPIAKQKQIKDILLLWFVYTLSACWASSGILCWAIWIRNLWGGLEAAERWPIHPDLGAFGVMAVAMAVLCIPLILVLLMAAGFWKGLCICFTRKPLKREDIEAVEMETGIGYNSDNITGEEKEEEEEDDDKK